ncbi:Carbonic anhydrase 5A, mitochondrial [Dufourea novaeangliae]|uniref:carbonic anhydrase n=1 Tax=Dufourea novaeangliae TaxID=178035 RepID=A0A154P4B8_DUFNO|nr:Carbonic anhydrase 5A, mitochondrial [Dufourea novaeangliae]
MAAGSRQSPVNIETDRVESDHEALSNKPLRWKYPATASRKLVNPGYCWRVDADGEGTFLSGGPLIDDVYKLEQYHCHWGCSDSRGSEHTVDSQAFAGENRQVRAYLNLLRHKKLELVQTREIRTGMKSPNKIRTWQGVRAPKKLHLVHWNTSKYNTFAEAAKASDGLAVLGVFLKVGKTHHEMDKIARMLPYVSHKDEVVEIAELIDPSKLLPDDNGYWTYLGSLTTPPCNESVTWILFKKCIEVSHHQLNIFRNLRKFPRGEECPCHENHGVVSVLSLPTINTCSPLDGKKCILIHPIRKFCPPPPHSLPRIIQFLRNI